MRKLLLYWQKIRYSLWFIPAIIVTFALGLAAMAVAFDSYISADLLPSWPYVFGSSADGARGMLQAIASAMITVAGLTFSITILILQMGASQYTPRIIRTFMGNRPTQTVLGVFIGIFVYCLVVLRSVRGGGESFVPSVSIILAILLALVGVGFLVYFIHHVASSIQASAIAAAVAKETVHVIDTLYPDTLDNRPESDPCRYQHSISVTSWHPVPSRRTGYLQSVDIDALEDFAKKHDLIVRMEKAAGSFVSAGMPIAFVSVVPDKKMSYELDQAYAIDHYRTVEQDVGVGIRQIVDIALKAMSPAMNDTTTASMCVDYLLSIMIRLVPRSILLNHCYSEGKLLVITKGTSFGELLRLAFEEIRENAQTSAGIYIRLLESLEALASVTQDKDRKHDIAVQVQSVMEYARRQPFMPDQQKRIEERQLQALKSLQS